MKYEVKCLFSFFVYGVRFAASSRKFHAKTYTMALKNLLMEAGFEEDVIISFESKYQPLILLFPIPEIT